jgi:acetyl esterase/lipase
MVKPAITRTPPLRVAVLLRDLDVGEIERNALQVLTQLDREMFAPELWLLSGGAAPLSEARAAGITIVHLSNSRRVGVVALARLARRLWRYRPDLLYALTAAPNVWGRLLAQILRIPVVSGHLATSPRCERRLYQFSARIIANSAALADTMTARFGVEPERISVIPNGVSSAEMARLTQLVLLEVGQCGTSWTTTAEGRRPSELLLPTSSGQDAHDDKIIERGRFRPDRSVRRTAKPSIAVFLPPDDRATGVSIVICPGGAYSGVTIDREGHDVARWLAANGIAGIVLKYRLPRPDITGSDTPWPLQDVAVALAITRERAAEWRIDPARVGAMGFSAGGHMVAATPGLAFVVLVYPVITMERKVTHAKSRLRLLGRRPSAALVERYSLERQITAQTPPSFLVHARDDKVVPVANSIHYAQALRVAGVDHELVLFEHGGHGFGLGAKGSEPAVWPQRLMAWLRERDLIRT